MPRLQRTDCGDREDMKITNIKFARCAKFHGGLFFGFKINFPCGIVDVDNHRRYTDIGVLIGLIFWTVSFGIDYGFSIDEDNKPEILR